nr:PREDICTED: josephin-2 isoform X1 [Apteryx mantelli mantelli]
MSEGGSEEEASERRELYHERQRLELCAVHALNNVLQRPCFTQEAADEICKRLAPEARLNPHRSVLGTGNYDVNVIMAALQSLELAAVWWDKRRSLERLALGRIVGFILNVPSNVSLGFVSLPVSRKHWLAVRQLRGTYYNLDSKLKAPARIGGEGELRYGAGGTAGAAPAPAPPPESFVSLCQDLPAAIPLPRPLRGFPRGAQSRGRSWRLVESGMTAGFRPRNRTLEVQLAPVFGAVVNRGGEAAPERELPAANPRFDVEPGAADASPGGIKDAV